MTGIAFFVVLGCTAATMLLGWAYFRRYQLPRPPLGVVNLWDVGMLVGAIVVVPFLYLALPLWLATGLLAVALLSVLYTEGEPVLPHRWLLWLLVLGLLGADVATARHGGPASASFWIVNNAVLLLAVVGLSNLWAQGGMKARDLALLAGALTLYDLVATGWLPLSSALANRLAGAPFVPLLAWGTGQERLGIGLGDLLLATLFPLVMHKAFGPVAGRVALASALGLLVALFGLAELLGLGGMLPTMTALGPLMVLQYFCWRRHAGAERTMWQFRQGATVSYSRTVAPAPAT
jgi:hypothetical protein